MKDRMVIVAVVIVIIAMALLVGRMIMSESSGKRAQRRGPYVTQCRWPQVWAPLVG